jgi:prolyl-tRNA synthetase
VQPAFWAQPVEKPKTTGDKTMKTKHFVKNFIKATGVKTVVPHGSDEIIMIMSKNADEFGLILPREAACILSCTLPGAIAESYRNKPHQASTPHLNLLAKSAKVGPGQSQSDHAVLYLDVGYGLPISLPQSALVGLMESCKSAIDAMNASNPIKH